MAVKPLSWPDSIRRPSGLQKFLTGMPLIGPDRVAYRALRREVADRPEDCLALWKQDEQTISTRDAMIDILQKAVSWKSRKFIPDDPCEILFWDPFDGMDLLDAVYRMEKRFGVKMDGERIKEMFAMTFGELVEAIIDKRWEATPPGYPTEKDHLNKLGCAVMAIPVLMVLALVVLYDCWDHAWLGPAAISWALKVTAVLGLLNVVLVIVAWARSKKEGVGFSLFLAITSLVMALFIYFCLL